MADARCRRIVRDAIKASETLYFLAMQSVRQALTGEQSEVPPNIVSVEFRRKEDATLFKMFWGAE